jgi:AsmA protein
LGQALGREVSLSGAVRPTLWPHLGVRAEGVRVGNPEWVTQGPLIAAEALSLRVPWSAVLSGEVLIDEITLVGPQITLVRSRRRAGQLGAGPPTRHRGPPRRRPRPRAATSASPRSRISDGSFAYIDSTTGQTLAHRRS